MRAKGWQVGCYDPARGVPLSPELQAALEASPYVLSSVPPMGLALYDPALSAQKALLRPLAAAGRIRWFGYLSSTGVYGDWQGEWVDESSPCRQTSQRAIVRQEAEAAWQGLGASHGLPVHVFRLGGIYGPGRSALDSLTQEAPSASQQRRGRQRYTARCHVGDICAVVAASMGRPRPGAVYNVVDDDPAPRSEVMTFARTLVGGGQSQSPGQAPPGSEADPEAARSTQREGGSESRSGADGGTGGDGAAGGEGGATGGEAGGRRGGGRRGDLDEKRVRNGLIRSDLGVELRYPSYREGLAALHGGATWPLEPGDLALL
ncbi:hypothetical protein HYH03_009466 [Edaphochlamys debaryana]|uniref:NAD-dependent epimerase/dehydratase domain-containing protein n=1 Tax=Edaphochlamys debaryana TaxID=47281 RepID=A0A836BX03_9CHLO|nr:hypothetical protein HYH03_009466 [Edaphochlamys debaryana]|eukprot:KAG2492221.1 hypothetical protein HYH03_009466 [Edaphochlamys debaryana]